MAKFVAAKSLLSPLFFKDSINPFHVFGGLLELRFQQILGPFELVEIEGWTHLRQRKSQFCLSREAAPVKWTTSRVMCSAKTVDVRVLWTHFIPSPQRASGVLNRNEMISVS